MEPGVVIASASAKSSFGGGTIPLPESEIVAGESGALLVTMISPVAAPGIVGANVTVKEVSSPGASSKSVPVWSMENAAPVAAIEEMVTASVPGFESMMVFLSPTR